MGLITLENEQIAARFDDASGALVELTDPKTGWQIIRRPALGLSFEMLVPLPDRLNNRVLGIHQRLSNCQFDPERQRLVLTWDKLVSESGTRIEATFTGAVTLNQFGLQFDGQVINRSDHTIDNVAWPVIGELAPPADAKALDRFTAGWSEGQRTPLWPAFRNEQGYWGADYPMQKSHSPHVPFVLVCTDRQGLYIGHHDVEDRELVQFLFEMKPGVQNTFNDAVMPGEELNGEPVRVQLTMHHFTFAAPGQTHELSPILLRPYSGTWHAGADCYKRWRASWHKPAPTPEWCKTIHSWQQVQINSIAGEQRCRYDQIIKHAEQCARHGVEVIQLTGWTKNGQDGWLPSHHIDERLGTGEELKAAIAKIRELGVRIVLYGKFVYADIGTPWYRDELHRYISLDRAGNTTGHSGWAYSLPSHFAEVNMRRLNWACMNHQQWRRVCREEYQHMLSFDADGILLDESCHPRGDGRFCFAPDHGHEVPAFNCRGDRVLLAELNQIAAAHRREQLISCEAAHDKHTCDYGLSYFRIFAGHVPVLRYIDPHYPILVGLWGYDDREKINMCLMYRYLIEYEPLNFKGYLEEAPLTLEYGKKVDALRRRYQAQLWDAVFEDVLGATVTVNRQPYKDYSVFRNADGRRTIVIANHDQKNNIEANVAIDDYVGGLWAASPEAPEAQPVSGAMTIPPRSVAVVFQEPP